MGLPGRKPTTNTEQLRNKTRSQSDWTEVLEVPYTGGAPDLPEFRTVITRNGQEDVRLQTMTGDWWAIVSVMPHCILWTDSDWMFALSTALVADAAFCGVSSAATELRNREKVLGTTVEYRRDLRIRYVDSPTITESAEVPNLADYRDL